MSDREHMYTRVHNAIKSDSSTGAAWIADPIRCGFQSTKLSAFDHGRAAFADDAHCLVGVIATIANCYDHIPSIFTDTLPESLRKSVCMLALLDNVTYHAMMAHDMKSEIAAWRVVLLDPWPPIIEPAKLSEVVKVLGHRYFPMVTPFSYLIHRLSFFFMHDPFIHCLRGDAG